MQHDELEQVFGAPVEAAVVNSGHALRITGEVKPTLEAAAVELGECSALPNFLFGYVDEQNLRAVVFLQDTPDSPPPESGRMHQVRFVLGPSFLQSQ